MAKRIFQKNRYFWLHHIAVDNEVVALHCNALDNRLRLGFLHYSLAIKGSYG